VIRIVAIGIVGLVGTGAVIALGRIPAPESPNVAKAIQYPVAETSRKSDRLPLIAHADTTVTAVMAAVTAMAMATVDTSSAITEPDRLEVAPRPVEPKAPPKATPKIISRHWQDNVDAKPKVSKRNYRSPLVRTVTPTPASEANNCSTSGFDTFLRSIKVKSDC
jgi:hypothetical protein